MTTSNTPYAELVKQLEQMTLMRDMLVVQLESHGIDPVVHVTARNTVASPISQEGSIAPEALSEDGQPHVTLENLDQLSEIISDASVEGWEWTTFTRPDGSPIETVEHVAETTAHSARISEGTELHGITFAGLGDEATGPNVVCYTGNGPHSAENARAIVSLWMAAPELIQLARSALSASPTPPQAVTDVGGGEPSRAPDGYSTDDEGGLLEDLLDGYDHGAITELTPYWCGERQWAVVHYDENGFADHRLFDSQDEARKFRDSTLLTNPNTEERGAVSGQDSGSSNCALEPTGAGASLSDGGE